MAFAMEWQFRSMGTNGKVTVPVREVLALSIAPASTNSSAENCKSISPYFSGRLGRYFNIHRVK